MGQRRRRLIAGLAVLTVATGLTGCGNAGGSSGEGEELHVLVGTISQHPEEQRAWFERMKQKFKARTGATLVFDTYSSSSEEQKKIQTSAVSGTGPDVYQLGTTFTPVAHSTKAFRVLSEEDWKKVGGRERFFGPQLAMSGPDAQNQIGVPMTMRPYGMVYNTEMFQAAGITAPPKTWDEFLAYAQRLKDPAASRYGAAIDYADPYNAWKYIWTLSMQGGGQFMNKDLTKSQMDTDKVAGAVGSYFDLVTRHQAVDPKAVGWKASEALSTFANGQAAMLPMVTPSARPTLEKSAVKGKYAFAPMPLVPFGATDRPPGGVAAGSIVSGDDIGVASYSQNPELALSYIELVTNPEEQKFYYETFGDLPANAQVTEELAKADPQFAAFADAAKTSVPTSFTGAWSDVQIALTNVVTQSLPGLAGGGYDPGAVRGLLTEANRTVQDSLDRQGR